MEFRIYPTQKNNIYPQGRQTPYPPTDPIPNFYNEIVLSADKRFGLMSIDGIDPVDCTINTSHLVGVNGERYNSSFLNGRTITITVAINAPAEQNRRVLFNTCRVNTWVGMEFRLDDKTLFISGIVKQIPTTYFDKKEVCQIIVYCPSPEFKRIATPVTPMRIITIPVNGEEVEFEIYGDLPTYPLFDVTMDSHACSFIKINKTYTAAQDRQTMKVEYDMSLNYNVVINCRPSERDIVGFDFDTNIENRLLAYLTNDSSWIKYDFENNYGNGDYNRQTYRISVEDDTGLEDGQEVSMIIYDLYQGV